MKSELLHQVLRNRRKNKGKGQFLENYGLTIIIVVGVIAAILILYALFGNTTSLSGEVSDVTTAVSQIQQQYKGDANGFKNISATSIVPDVPSDEISGGAWVAPIGGTVTVAAATSYGTLGDSFTLTFPQVPVSDCTKLISAFSSALTVQVGTTTVVSNLAGGTGYSATAAATACTGTSPLSISMTFGSVSG